MNTASESSKLAELRAKTDRQLVAILNLQINRGLQLRHRGELRESEKIYETVRLLLALVSDITPEDRGLLEWKLSQLRGPVRRLSSDADLRMQTACS